MELPEVVRRSRIRDSELVEDEGVEVWDNTVEESARARGIDIVTLKKMVETEFEGV